MERETMDQPTIADCDVEGILVTESGEEISSTPMIVQQASAEDSTFHFQMKGQTGGRY